MKYYILFVTGGYVGQSEAYNALQKIHDAITYRHSVLSEIDSVGFCSIDNYDLVIDNTVSESISDFYTQDDEYSVIKKEVKNIYSLGISTEDFVIIVHQSLSYRVTQQQRLSSVYYSLLPFVDRHNIAMVSTW